MVSTPGPLTWMRSKRTACEGRAQILTRTMLSPAVRRDVGAAQPGGGGTEVGVAAANGSTDAPHSEQTRDPPRG